MVYGYLSETAWWSQGREEQGKSHISDHISDSTEAQWSGENEFSSTMPALFFKTDIPFCVLDFLRRIPSPTEEKLNTPKSYNRKWSWVVGSVDWVWPLLDICMPDSTTFLLCIIHILFVSTLPCFLIFSVARYLADTSKWEFYYLLHGSTISSWSPIWRGTPWMNSVISVNFIGI